MFKFTKTKRDNFTDDYVLRMLHDGIYTDILKDRLNDILDDHILIKFIDTNYETDIAKVIWVLKNINPVSNRVVRHIVDNWSMFKLLPYICTSYYIKYTKKKNISSIFIRQILSDFKGVSNIPTDMIKLYIGALYRENRYDKSYIEDFVAMDLLSDRNINNLCIESLSQIMTITNNHITTYIQNGGNDIRSLNYILDRNNLLDLFCTYVSNNDDIDLSLLDQDILTLISNDNDRIDHKLMIKVISSNISNINFLSDSVVTLYQFILRDSRTNINVYDLDISDEYITQPILHNFLNRGGLLCNIPNQYRQMLNFSLYRTSLMSNTNNIEYIPDDVLEELLRDLTVVTTLFEDDEFMVIDNRRIIAHKLYPSIKSVSITKDIYTKFPLLFRVYIDPTLTISHVQDILLSHPEYVDYVPSYMVTHEAYDFCISRCHMSITTLFKMNTQLIRDYDLWQIIRFRFHESLLLPESIFNRLIRDYRDSIQSIINFSKC